MLKNLQIKQYQKTILTHILSSQFVYKDNSKKCEIKRQILIIKNKKKKHLYYLYLFLTANKKPYVKKEYTKTVTRNNVKVKSRGVTWQVEIKKRKLDEILTTMLFQIVPFQTNAEKPILDINRNDFDLSIWHTPLTFRTAGLKPQNNYLPDIRLIWRLKWTKNASLFQKIFILKHLKVINENITFNSLENQNE